MFAWDLDGPIEFWNFGAEKLYGFAASEEGYRNKCQLCYAIRKYLVEERQAESPDLAPVGHYRYG